MAQINTLSPFSIVASNALLTEAELILYIYTGAVNGAWTGNATYTLSATEVNGTCVFEVADLIKDFISANFDGTYDPDTEDAVWVDYRLTQELSSGATATSTTLGTPCYYGYGYFLDGANPQLFPSNTDNKATMQDNNTIYVPYQSPVRIPIRANAVQSVSFEYQGQLIRTQTTFASTTDSAGLIQYINNINDTEEKTFDTYKSFVTGRNKDLSEFESSPLLEGFLNEDPLFPCDTIHIADTDGDVMTYNVENLCECKYDPVKLTFYNKYGALQDLWFFKNTTKNLKILKSTTYTTNLLKKNGTYDVTAHQDRILDKNGQTSLLLNSGWYSEDNNEAMKQLMLSEKVWIFYDNQTIPCVVTDSSFTFKNSLTDKLFQHQLQVDFAFSTINDVR